MDRFILEIILELHQLRQRVEKTAAAAETAVIEAVRLWQRSERLVRESHAQLYNSPPTTDLQTSADVGHLV